MLKRVIFTLTAFATLAACQPRQGVGNSGSSLNGSPSSPATSAGPKASAEGTSDGGGGGNGINHIPLEGFHVDMLGQDEAKARILPLIQDLAKVDLEFAAKMYHVLTQRSWKFIPVTMERLSSERIGTYFPTDQFALQDTKEVWIDKTNFAAMTAENRSELIIHELIMGIKIMQFTGSNDHCKVKVDAEILHPKNAADVKAPDHVRMQCDHDFKEVHGFGADNILEVGAKLSDDDYARIRTLTEKISEHQGAFDADEVSDWVQTSGLDQD